MGARARAFRPLQGDLLALHFFNRKRELGDLADLLASDVLAPGRMVIITGPKDSGKSALIREYRRQQSGGIFPGVSSYIDMREYSNINPAGFAGNLYGSLAGSMLVKANLGIKVLGADFDFEAEYNEDVKNDPLSAAMSTLESYCLQRAEMWEGFSTPWVDAYKQGFPTVFIDEANALSAWRHAAEDGKTHLDTLLRFLMRISKQECGAHVVMASSENFFRKWLLSSAAVKGHQVQVFNVGHLPEDEAKAFLLERTPACLKLEVENIWTDVFEHVGGALLSLHDIVQLAHRALAEGDRLQPRWEREKKRLLMNAIYHVEKGMRPEQMTLALGHGRDPPQWTKEDWTLLVRKMADSPNGVIPYNELGNISGLDSMIEHDFLQFRAYSDTEYEIHADEWPVVLPMSKMAHHAMKSLA